MISYVALSLAGWRYSFDLISCPTEGTPSGKHSYCWVMGVISGLMKVIKVSFAGDFRTAALFCSGLGNWMIASCVHPPGSY